MNNSNYYSKYLKYKNKYLNLKNQIGGNKILEEFIKIFEKHVKILEKSETNYDKQSHFRVITSLVNPLLRSSTDFFKEENEELFDKLRGLLNRLREWGSRNVKYHERVEEIIESVQIVVPIYLDEYTELLNESLKKKSNDDAKREEQIRIYENEMLGLTEGNMICTPEEVLLENKSCNKTSQRAVIGSCGEDICGPNIIDLRISNTKKINYEVHSNKLLKIFTNLFDEFEASEEKYCIFIILGGEGKLSGDDLIKIKCEAVRESYVIDIKPGNSESEGVINSQFPLNINDEKSKLLCDLLIEKSKNDKFEIYLVNNICGTCQPSFFYLVTKNESEIKYIVQPNQGLNDFDNANVKRCFK